MICECYISSELLDFPKHALIEIKETIEAIYGKFVILPEDFPAIIDLLKHDKKNVGGQVNFVLLNNIEDYKIDCKVPEEMVVKSLEYYNS